MIVRNRPEKDFTVLRNEVLERDDLSLKAKGLWAFLMTKPDGWQTTINGLQSQLSEGKRSLQGALRELEQAGLYRKVKIIVKGQKGVVWEDYVYDQPWEEAQENILEHNSDELALARFAYMQNAALQIAPVQNAPQVNTNIVNTELSKNETSKKRKSSDIILSEISQILDEQDSALREALLDFIEHRKAKKSPITPRALQLTVDKLYKLYPDNVEKQIESINQSIMCGWQGVFPVQESRVQNSKPQREFL